MKFVRARTVEVGPGLHFWWPISTEIEIFNVVRNVLNLRSQTLLTRDGKTVVASGVLTYSIVDLPKFAVENYDAVDSIAELGLAGLRRAVVQRTFAQLSCGLADVDRRLTKECQRLLTTLGVEVESARLADFAPVTAISILGEQRKNEHGG
jgi:regulator of protease activity HflC (stomatin/prohibitin superfamily)